MIKNKKKFLKDNLFVYSLILYPLILFCIFWIATNFNSILLAFQRIDGTGRHFNGLKNFKDFISSLFTDGDLLAYAFKNSILWWAISLVLGFFVNTIYSYLIYKKCVGQKAIRFIVLIPSMMSGLVVSLVFLNMIGSSGLLTHLFKIFDIRDGRWISLLHTKKYAFATCFIFSFWTSLGSALILIPNAMRGVNSEVIESAQIDGINNMFQELWYIILPLIWPTMSTFWVTGIAGIFSNAGPLMGFYDLSAPDYTYLMGYYWTRMIVYDSTEIHYPLYAAGGLIITLIVAPLTIFVKWALEKFGPTTE